MNSTAREGEEGEGSQETVSSGSKKKATGRSQRRGKQKRENENTCQACGGHYDDDDEAQEGWIGCDERGCWRWYHYWCVGHLDMHDPKLRWICPACREEDD